MQFLLRLVCVLCGLALTQQAWAQTRVDPNAPWGKLHNKRALASKDCYTPPDYNQPFARFPVQLEIKLPDKAAFCATERFKGVLTKTARMGAMLPITVYGVSFGTVGKAETHLAYHPKTSAGGAQAPITVSRGEAFGWRMSTNIEPQWASKHGDFVEVLVPPSNAGGVQSVYPYPIRWGTLFAKGTNGQWYANTQGLSPSDADVAYRRTGEKSFQMAQADKAVYAFWQTTISPSDSQAQYLRDVSGTLENFWQPTVQDPNGEYTIELWWHRKLVARQVFVLQ